MGCAKNEVDSEHMAARLVEAGYEVVDDPETADVVIVNTCTFIQAATEESIDAILEVAGYDSISSGSAHLVVAGCMPARYGDDLADELTEASCFVPCSKEDSKKTRLSPSSTMCSASNATIIHRSISLAISSSVLACRPT